MALCGGRSGGKDLVVRYSLRTCHFPRAAKEKPTMATSPAIHPVPLSPSQIFTTPVTALPRPDPEDYIPTRKVDGKHVLAPGYSHLSGLQRAYALATAEEGIPEHGKRTTHCNNMGAMHAIAEDRSLGFA